MKIVFIVAHVDGTDEWQETYEDNGKFGRDTPTEIIKRVMDNFNATLRPGEKGRRLVRIESSEGEFAAHIIPHTWEKQNLVTIQDRHGIYDKMKCRVCGIMGKRFGLNPKVTPDLKFAHPVYKSCTRYDL